MLGFQYLTVLLDKFHFGILVYLMEEIRFLSLIYFVDLINIELVFRLPILSKVVRQSVKSDLRQLNSIQVEKTDFGSSAH